MIFFRNQTYYSLLESVEEVNDLGDDVSNHNTSEIPYVGWIFPSLEEAERFYEKYARNYRIETKIKTSTPSVPKRMSKIDKAKKLRKLTF